MLAQAGSLNTIEIARDKVEKLQKNTFDLLQTHIEALQKAKEATIQTDEAKTRMAKAERAKEKTKQAIEWINLVKEETF